MPEVKDSEGNVIANLPYTDEGMEQAKDMKEANPSLNVDYSPGGMTDGAARSVTEYAGGGKTGYSAIGAERPMYKIGGKVEKKLKKTKKKLESAEEKYQKQLDKELAKDIKKERKPGTTTKKRRTRARKLQKAVKTAADIAAVTGYPAGMATYMKAGPTGVGTMKKIAKAVMPSIVGGAMSDELGDINTDEGTIFEPKLRRKEKLKKKVKKLKSKGK